MPGGFPPKKAGGMAVDFMKAAPKDTIRVLVTDDTVAERKDVYKGQILDLPVEDAMDLIRSSKAVKYVAPVRAAEPKVETVAAPHPINESADETGKKISKDVKGDKK